MQHLDIYVTSDVPRKYREGMKLFWWYGFLIATSFSFVNGYLTLYALSLGATGVEIGTLSSLSSFMAMLAPIPGAQWAARWGKRKWVVVITFALRRLALLGALLVPFFLTGRAAIVAVIALLALRVGLGNLGSPAWSSMAADLVPMERRGRYFSSRKTVMAVAALVFVPLAGQFIEWIGEPLGYQIAFGVAILFAAAALYVYAMIPERSSTPPAEREKDLGAFWRALVENRTFFRFTLFSMVFNFFWQLGGPYFGVYRVEELGATPTIVGVLGTAGAVMRIAGRQVWGRAVDRRGPRWVFVLCVLLVPFLPFIWFPLTNAWQLLLVVIPSGFLWSGRALANFTLQLELSEPEHRTQAIAGYKTLIGVANILGPLVGGQIVEILSYKWNFAISGMGRMLGALLLLSLLKPFRRPKPSV
jgi:MFS family permease